jgi:hypothetical protein
MLQKLQPTIPVLRVATVLGKLAFQRRWSADCDIEPERLPLAVVAQALEQ